MRLLFTFGRFPNLPRGRLFFVAAAARNLAQEAVDTLPYGRALPLLHAKAAAALARCQRHMLLPPPVNPIKLTVPEMASARSGLQQCLSWAVHDGGHDHDVIRFAMLEAAALLLANKELNSANDIMQIAYFMSKKMQTLRHATHTIDGVSAGSLPKVSHQASFQLCWCRQWPHCPPPSCESIRSLSTPLTSIHRR